MRIDQDSAIFITRKPDDTVGGIKPSCDPVFEVSAEVSRKSEDGAFKEDKSVTITRSQDYSIPTIEFTQYAEHLEGTLSIEASENWDASLFYRIMLISTQTGFSRSTPLFRLTQTRGAL